MNFESLSYSSARFKFVPSTTYVIIGLFSSGRVYKLTESPIVFVVTITDFKIVGAVNWQYGETDVDFTYPVII